MANPSPEIQAAEVVLPCPDLEPTLAFFIETLGFRLDAIFPADAPRVAVVSGHGVRLRLDAGECGLPGHLRLLCRSPEALGRGTLELTAPNGTKIALATFDPPIDLPHLSPSLVVSKAGDGHAFVRGRAGMDYRDLIPDRQGGRFIASHIRIAEGGPVQDYPHDHKVRFQMIYCYLGWVRVVYEDQGPPFVLNAGDCVLQPPRIGHRVLESSAGLEVIEITSPANHETLVRHDLELPTKVWDGTREFSGQRFVRHEAARASWKPWRCEGFRCRDLGMELATGGLASAHVVRASGGSFAGPFSHEGEILFVFVLQGGFLLRIGTGHDEPVGEGDSFVVPAQTPHELRGVSPDAEFLVVTL